jgi:hypothetical protein
VSADSPTESPWERWSRDTKALNHVTEDVLLRAFVLFLDRTVSNDRVVPIEGTDYELPAALGPRGGPNRRIQITHRLLDDTYHVVCGDRLVRIHPVDLAANARARRDCRQDDPADPSSPPVKTAADLAFERDFGPVVDDDGGLHDHPDFDEPTEGSTT